MKHDLYKIALIVFLGFCGYILLTLPGTLIHQYEAARAHGESWGYIYLGTVCLGFLLFLGASVWAFIALYKNRKTGTKKTRAKTVPASKIPEKEKLKEISKNIKEAKRAVDDADKDPGFRKALEDASRRIEYRLEQEVLEIAAFGTISSGKSSLLNALAGRKVFDVAIPGGTTRIVREVELPGGDRVKLVDTPGLAEAQGGERQDLAKQAARTADLVLFVIDGPLKAFEFDMISQLCAMGKRVLVCLNKQDWYSSQDLEILLNKLRQQLRGLVNPEDIVAVQAAPVRRKVIRVTHDGKEKEETEEISPDISVLSERMYQLIQGERRQLVLCNLLLQSRMLKREVAERLRKKVLLKAKAVVESYTWKAALAAALSPTPVLDLAVGLGFSLKMIIEIAAVFEKRIELNHAKELLDKLLKNLYASLGASALAPAVSQVVASGLKGMPAVGTLSGGALQGIVQALVTRWTGSVMVEYFQQETDAEAQMDLQAVAMEKWKQMTSPSQLASLAVEGLKRFEAGSKGEAAR